MKILWMRPTQFMSTKWDWEKVIPNGSRNLAYLKETVEKIYKAIRLTELAVEARYDIESILPKQITFIHTEDW